MRKAGISELREHPPLYVARVKKGEAIQITQHGEAVARLVPEQDPAQAARDKLAEWAKTAIVGDAITPLDEEWTYDADNL